MKLKNVAIALMLATSSTLFAQVDSVAVITVDSVAVPNVNTLNNDSPFHFGIKIGTNYSGVYDSEGEDFDPRAKFGFAGGFFATLPVTVGVAIQPEVLFSQKGFIATGTLYDRSYKVKRITNFIDVPVFFVLRPFPALSLLVGPQYSYLINQKNEFYNATTTIQQELAFDDEEAMRRSNMAFVIGADLNRKRLVLSGRIGWDLLQNSSATEVTTPQYKNWWGQLTLGYRF
jgi:hypothetical protein